MRSAALKEIEILRNLIARQIPQEGTLGSMTRERMQQTADLMVKYLDLRGATGRGCLHQRIPG